jgi:2,4-dienoyl-CoA reductase-like NADH-dependent reductase (Old Yellow Enzyme family)
MQTDQVDLFSPITIGSLELRNRLVRSATAENLSSDPDGYPLPALVNLYADLARGGVGLVISGHACVAPRGKAHFEMMGAYSDELLPGLQALADAVHAEGGRIALQINHGGRQCDPACTPDMMAPSAVPMPGGVAPKEMTQAEIVETVDAFGQAARRAKVSGMDAVQLHMAHGYLGSQFFSPHTNRRTDAWGGDFERRLCFLSAVCESVRGQVGDDYPMFAKLGMMDNIERVPGGLTPQDGACIVARLAEFGLDAVEISGASGGDQSDFNVRGGVGTKAPEAYFRHLAQSAKRETDLPVILVGGLRSRAVMDEVLNSGDADMISLCRPLINEPDLPNRLLFGATTQSACISGSRCWPKNQGEGIRCKCRS